MIPLITIVGNRPQFIKVAPIAKEFKNRGHKPYIIHTGQHYDQNLSQVFFDEMDIPPPDITLKITGKTHGQMTAEMLTQLEEHFLKSKPKGILLFGDTNSTLAAALAAVKLKIPIAHVEAGPRIHDINNPEEINRIITDRASRLLFCPDMISVENLKKESITEGVYFTGDVMYDTYLLFSERSSERSNILQDLQLESQNYILMTLHRAENTDSKESLICLIELLKKSREHFVFPIHPRTSSALKNYHLWEKFNSLSNVKAIPPVGYLDLLSLLNGARMILTDSGGLQKEAYFAGKPVLLLFHETPWPQIKKLGWQKVVGALENIELNQVIEEIQHYSPPPFKEKFFGNGTSAKHIVDLLEEYHWL